MNVKSQNSPKIGVEPHDAPELTEEFLANGVWPIGDTACQLRQLH